MEVFPNLDVPAGRNNMVWMLSLSESEIRSGRIFNYPSRFLNKTSNSSIATSFSVIENR